MDRQLFISIIKYLGCVVKGTEYRNHLYAVGGCIRDFYLGDDTIKDIDLVLDIENGGVKFANWLYDNRLLASKPVIFERFGTVTFILKEFPDIQLEAVHTRKEKYDGKTRKPIQSYASIVEDALRRDLTINALYLNVNDEVNIESIIDPTGNGLYDIENHIIDTPTNPVVTLNDDPLRILRVYRFAAKYGWKTSYRVDRALSLNMDRLSIVSQERIYDEFIKMVQMPFYNEVLKLIPSTLLKIIFHNLTNFDYNVNYTEELGLVGYIALLLKENYEDDIFMSLVYGKFPNSLRDKVCQVIHYLHYNSINDYDIRKYALQDKECYRIYLMCTIITCEKRFNNRIPSLIRNLKLFDKYVEKFNDYKLPIDGNDIIEHLNLSDNEKPLIKEVLNYIYDYIFATGLLLETKESCLEKVRLYKELYL